MPYGFEITVVVQEGLKTCYISKLYQLNKVIVLCKAVLALSIFVLILISLYEMCLGILHYISLYALILHSTLAHHQVPFSSGVSQNKRISTLQSNKLKLSLHITQTETYL